MSSSELCESETHVLECFAFDPHEKKYTKLSTKRGIGPNDVLIKTTHSGLCYTDVHAKTRGCGLGHEGVGVVEKIGVAVKNLEAGDRLPDWFNVLPLLDRMARIVLMTIQNKPLSIPYMPFILPGHRIISSTEASRKNHLEMLEFAARNHIKP
ncbi:hypothetical protein KVT40_007708 [Elsinoe batatas]|uniref:Alcohol dehydrogenase-like N-terminal domain-containing protein n=1 Tax=Elsinoe batatas TaxID=2601811 RepID=A0A8K0KV73_9PEZI|nr:hypothetical protein KVT40_007708 [Elsinoe batatas]